MVLAIGATNMDAQPATYTYTGNQFTFAVEPFTTAMNVTGTFTLANPIPPNTTLSLTPTGYSFSDGIDTLTAATSTILAFDVATDGNGQITHWTIYIYAGPRASTINFSDGYGDIVYDIYGYGPPGHPLAGEASVSTPGAWNNTQIPATPAPPTALLMTGGLIALALLSRMRIFQANRPTPQ